jgi:hypothetical protein
MTCVVSPTNLPREAAVHAAARVVVPANAAWE